MKYVKLTVLLILISNFSIAQNLDYENQVAQKFKKEKRAQNLQKKIIFDISGVCDAITMPSNQNAGIGWDDCTGPNYEGPIVFEAMNGNSYNVYSINSLGDTLNDPSFGSFYPCYDIETQDGMPNGDTEPTLFFYVSSAGDLTFAGASQWGEIFSVSNIVMSGSQLNFKWTNDYGEGADVQLIRQDEKIWEELLVGCTICSASDSLALVALYNATGGSNWNITWDLTTRVEDWYGVTLNESCCVSEIDLGPSSELTALGFTTNNLTGELPEELGNLSGLTLLDLSINQIEGEVLSKLTNLTDLEYLNLSGNLFTGAVPVEISNLDKLEFISLTSNDFASSLPAEIGGLTSLEIWFSSLNNFMGEIPSEVGQLSNLRQLSMWGNNLSGILPSELGNLESLFNITLDYNDLSGEIPESIALLPNLLILRLSFNQLIGSIPEGFVDLQIVRFNDNNMSGEIPESFASESILTGFLPREMNLTNNNFTGEFPSRFFQNTINQGIYLSNNDFSGCAVNTVNICLKTFNPIPDTVMIGNETYLVQLSNGYDLRGNPRLAWEGALQNICSGQTQIGAPCNDGDPNTTGDGIDENCDCVADIVATIDIEELNSVSVAPNPLILGQPIHINIELNNSLNIHLNLVDINGKIVLDEQIQGRKGTNTISLKSDNLTRGLYFLQLTSDKGVNSSKIIIE